jgi:hypothetical protein
VEVKGEPPLAGRVMIDLGKQLAAEREKRLAAEKVIDRLREKMDRAQGAFLLLASDYPGSSCAEFCEGEARALEGKE